MEKMDLPEYQNLHGECEELAEKIILALKRIYKVNPPIHVIDFIKNNPLSIAQNPHELDRFGYRLDGNFY